MKVVDKESREKLGPEQVGEVCLLADTVSPGYLNNPDANASSWDEEGFFLTGDAGEFRVLTIRDGRRIHVLERKSFEYRLAGPFSLDSS